MHVVDVKTATVLCVASEHTIYIPEELFRHVVGFL